MAVLSPTQVYALSQKYFGDLGQPIVDMMARIALLESGGNTSAYNGTGLDNSYGLWQVNVHPEANPQYASLDLTNPEVNAQAAREILLNQGPTAWSTYQQATGGGSMTNWYGPPKYPTSPQILQMAGLEAGTVLPLTQQQAGEGEQSLEDVLKENGYTQIPGTNRWVGFDYGTGQADVIDLGALTQGETMNIGGVLVRMSPDGETAQVLLDTRKDAAVTPEQKLLQQLQNMQLAQQIGLTGAGAGGLQSLGGGFFDPLTRDLIDPSALGLSRDQFNEAVRQFGLTFPESQRQFDVEQGGLNQRASLQAALGGFQSVNQLAPQLGQLALDNAAFTSKTLSTPQDYLARAFFQRGGESPLPVVTQADVINQLRSNISGFNNVLSGFNTNPLNSPLTQTSVAQRPPPPAPPAPRVPQPTTAPPPVTTAAAPPNYLSPAGDPYSPEAQARFSQGVDEGSIVLAEGPIPTDNPSGTQLADTGFMPSIDENGNLIAIPMAFGGASRAPLMMVGDTPSGRPTGFEELVVNPTKAPISVVPNPMTQMRSPSPPALPEQASPTATENRFGGAMRPEAMMPRSFSLPEQAAPMARTMVPRFNMGTKIPRYADGTNDWQSVYDRYVSLGYQMPSLDTSTSGVSTGSSPTTPTTSTPTAPTTFYQSAPVAQPQPYPSLNFTTPTLPSPEPITQAQIIDYARRFSPPAVSDVVSGQMPASLRFGFPLPSPQMLAALTPAEREALNTRLAAEFNTDIGDVETAVRQRFLSPRERPMARLAVGV